MQGQQQVSTWVPTGSHTFCPACRDGNVWVAYFVYEGGGQGWRFFCRACGTTGPGEMKK